MNIKDIKINKDLEEISKSGVVSKIQEQLRDLNKKEKQI